MKETARARAAFERYCSLGLSRTFVELRAALLEEWGSAGLDVPAMNTIEIWSAKHNWQARVVEYESKQAEKARIAEAKEAERKRKKREKELEDMNERHALLGVTQQQKAIEQINALIKARKFGSQAVVTLLKLATDLERIARGANTEASRVEVAGDAERPLVIKTVWDRAILELAKDLEEEGESDDT